ncbi:MAG: sigma 54-interacting transcriptional regulator [Planctomycetota bacterium]|jgi:PAS domain S-box-containing protein
MVRDAAPPDDAAVLQVTRGVQFGERITIPAGDRIEVGRDPSAGVQLIGPQVSRRHFAIVHDGSGAFTVVDLGSGNGTFLNGKRVTEAPLAHGDRIAAGDTECRFVAPGARAPERTQLHVAPVEPGQQLRVEVDVDVATLRSTGIDHFGAQRMFELALPCTREQSPDRLAYATLETLQLAARADRSALLECRDADPPVVSLAVRRAPADPPALHRALPMPLLTRVAREQRAMVLRLGDETMLLAPIPRRDRLQVLFLGRDGDPPPDGENGPLGAAVVAGELLGRALERVDLAGHEDTRTVNMRLLIEGTEDMIFLLDDGARFTYANHWPGTPKGESADALLGRRMSDLVPLADREELLAALDSAMEGAEREFLETTLQRGDGSAVPVRLEFAPVHNPNGAVVAIRGQAHDQRELRALRASSRGGDAAVPPPRDRNAPPGAEALLGDSAAMRRVLQQIEQVQGQPYPVLVRGETGTGKELVARALHADGDRHEGPFVAVNCAALPDSLLELELFGESRGALAGAQPPRRGLVASADGGTLFLDEIGEMGPAMQARLLRVLEDNAVQPAGGDGGAGEPVDVRVVAATHRDLEAMAREGRFRHDLLYRLDVVRIELPPLRERPEDIPLLVEHGLLVVQRETGTKRGIDAAAVEALQQYGWPGNVRELLNVIRRCALQAPGELIRFEDLPAGIKQVEPAPTGRDGEPRSLREIERDAIVQALNAAGGNKQRAAQILGMPRATFYRRIKQYDLQHGTGPSTERR